MGSPQLNLTSGTNEMPVRKGTDRDECLPVPLRQDLPRSTLPTGSLDEAPAYAVGDAVKSGDEPGTVVAVDNAAGTFSVEWVSGRDKYGAIVYPVETTCLRKVFPWE